MKYQQIIEVCVKTHNKMYVCVCVCVYNWQTHSFIYIYIYIYIKEWVSQLQGYILGL